MAKNWRLVFYGETLEGHSVDKVKTKLVEVFKLTHDRVNEIFSGQEYIIRKDIPEEKLKQYVTALEKMGLKVYPLVEEASELDTKTLTTHETTPQKYSPTNDVITSGELKIDLSDKVECPRCSCIQPRRTLCRQCGLDMPRYRKKEDSNKDHYDKLELPPPLLGLNSDGRWGRVSYLSGCFIMYFIMFIGRVFAGILDGLEGLGELKYIIGLVFLAPIAFGVIKYQERIWTLRLHDLGLSNRWSIGMICLGVVGIVFWPLLILVLLFILYTLVWPGQKQANDYGVPVEKGSLLPLIACIVIFLAVSISQILTTTFKG